MSNKNTMKEMFEKQFDKETNYAKILSKVEGENSMKKILTMAASILIIFVIGVTAYAGLGGNFFGKPITQWIKFSDEYDKYIVEDNQSASYKETRLDLVSKVCDDGFTILEFNLSLSDSDIDKLNLYNTEVYNLIDGKFESKIASPKEALILSFNNEVVNIDGKNEVQGLNNFNIIIDGESYWIRPRGVQSISQISKNEFKIFQMYFLTEKELGEKKDFTITLKSVALYTQSNDCIVLNGEFNIEVSKDKAASNTKVIYPENEKVTYKKMTKMVDKVTITPLQTIVKVTSTINDLSLRSLTSTRSEDYIGICEYKVFDQNGNKLVSCDYEVKRTVIYKDGRLEEWEQGDIGTYKDFDNGKMVLTEYIVVEKSSNIDSITIKPVIRQPKDNEEIKIELDTFNINLKRNETIEEQVINANDMEETTFLK